MSKNHKHSNHGHNVSKKKNLKHTFIFFLLIIILVIGSFSTIFWHDVSPFYHSLYLKFESFVLADPLMSNVYLFFKTNILGMTPLGIFMMFFFTSLFFFPPFPSEAIFFTCISLKANIFLLVTIAVLASLVGQIANYGLGFFFKNSFSKKKGNDHKKWEGLITKFGGFLIFFANIIPLPSEIMSMIYGMSKFPFKKFVIITLIARIIKYVALALLFIYAQHFILGLFNIN